MIYQDILDFWFKELTSDDWFQGGQEVDNKIIERFTETHEAARHNLLWDWRQNIHGRLAEIIVLDQFSRNIFRGSAEAYAQDAQALALAQEAISTGQVEKLTNEEKSFLYMPFMHSESLEIHDKYAMKYFNQKGLEGNMPFEIDHRNTLIEFGRYPSRNEALGRESTAVEKVYNEEHGGW